MNAVYSKHNFSVSELVGVAILTWALKVLVGKWVVAKRVARGIRSCPPGGAVTLLNPFRGFALVSGSIYPFKNQMGWYSARFSLYRKYGSTCLASTTYWDAIPTYWLSDAEAIKAVTSDRLLFVKDVEAYGALNIYGHNLVGVEGAAWKRHRAIAKTAFNESNNAFVWQETTRIVNEWSTAIDNAASGEDSNTQVDLLRDLTRATLLIISSAGFGRRSSWEEDASSTPPPGHQIPFSPAVSGAIDMIIPRMLTPKPLWNAVTQRGVYIPFIGSMLCDAHAAFEALESHMQDLVSQARDLVASGKAREMSENKAALLKNLVEANMSYDKGVDVQGQRNLTDDELLSNMFVFFLAGHETTAHTLCFVFVYLALYPEYQKKVFEEALKVFPDGVPAVAPTSAYKEVVPQLEYASAVLHETLRFCPPVVRLGKMVQSDSILKAKKFKTSSDGSTSVIQEFDVPVVKGGMVVLDILALHMNPIHWGKDADEFRPERFIDTDTYKWPRDAFLAFSDGPRSCIGQRFAVTEAICMIASIVRRYEVLVPEDVIGMKFEEQVRVLTQWTPGVTIIPTNARVRFMKRQT